MTIGQVFHLTPLMGDLAAATARFEQLFAPHIWYRGFEGRINNRSAALMAISDFVIEPMQPHPPSDGRPATSHHRFVDRFGDAIHSLAVYCDDLDAIRSGLEAMDVRVTDGGMPTTVFTHPKDFPGLIEFYNPGLAEGRELNPRQHDGWSSAYWREVHPLGIEHASHVTLAVHDHVAAAGAYVKAFGVELLPDQPGRAESSSSSFVTFGPDTMIELAQPGDPESGIARHLERIGQTWWGMTFKVRSLDDVAAFLDMDHIGAPYRVDGPMLRIDPEWMFGGEYSFTDQSLDGDPRSS